MDFHNRQQFLVCWRKTVRKGHSAIQRAESVRVQPISSLSGTEIINIGAAMAQNSRTFGKMRCERFVVSQIIDRAVDSEQSGKTIRLEWQCSCFGHNPPAILAQRLPGVVEAKYLKTMLFRDCGQGSRAAEKLGEPPVSF